MFGVKSKVQTIYLEKVGDSLPGPIVYISGDDQYWE